MTALAAKSGCVADMTPLTRVTDSASDMACISTLVNLNICTHNMYHSIPTRVTHKSLWQTDLTPSSTGDDVEAITHQDINHVCQPVTIRAGRLTLHCAASHHSSVRTYHHSTLQHGSIKSLTMPVPVRQIFPTLLQRALTQPQQGLYHAAASPMPKRDRQHCACPHPHTR